MAKLIKYYDKYKWLMIFGGLLTCVQSVSELMLPSQMKVIVDEGIQNGDMSAIWSSGFNMIIFSIIVACCATSASLLFAVASAGFSANLRNAVFCKVVKSSENSISDFGTASLITRTTNDINQLQQFSVQARFLLMSPVMGVVSVVLAVIQAKNLSWVIVIVVILLAILIFTVLKIANPLFRSQQIKLDNLNRTLREGLTGVRVIRAFNRTKSDEKTFDNANSDLTETSLKVMRIMSIMIPFVNIIMNFTIIFVYWLGAKYISNQSLNIGQLTAFVQYVTHVMMSLVMFSMTFTNYPRAVVSAGRISQVLEINDDIADGTCKQKGCADGVEFRNVSFKFRGAERPVLKNISFKALPGTTTAIVGSTGSGKSTLVDLIPRFCDCENGEVIIDGVNVKKISKDDLRRKIGLVPQKAVLFSGTIAENIRYGKTDATDEDVIEAAKISKAFDFISANPDGFNRIVSQGGTNLSGGQKQRLSIARAVVRKPRIYIFDDCFSALDFKTDAALRAELKTKTANSVVIMVAQRVSTIMGADQIIVLKDGEIAGIGTHKQLYKSCETYREIVLSQHSEEEIEL